jgi:HEAT repeat protein
MKILFKTFLIFFLLTECCCASEIDSLLNQLISNDQAPDTKVLNELIKIGAPAIKPAVEKLKKETDQWKQQYYLMLLCSIANEDSSDDILPYTESESGNVREWAIFVLSKIGNQNSVKALINSLSDSAVEESAKEQAVLRLQQLTGQNIPLKESMSFEEKKSAIKEWQNYLKEKKPNK